MHGQSLCQRFSNAGRITFCIPAGRCGISMLCLILAWSGVVAAGIGCLWNYEHTAGVNLAAPDSWPADSRIPVVANQQTLLLFAHPKCPCTRASLGELARIMTVCGNRIQAYAVFVKPSECEVDPAWEKSDLWRSAEQIPGVTVLCDNNGTEAQRFRAMTSGIANLYDSGGQLLFRGGITASRGHSGDNAGRSAIADLILHGSADIAVTKVYGCALGTTIADAIQ